MLTKLTVGVWNFPAMETLWHQSTEATQVEDVIQMYIFTTLLLF